MARAREPQRPSRPYVAVIGPGGEASPVQLEAAEAVGRGLAEHGAIVITGGLGGVMAAASRGAASAGGTVVGILPGTRDAANQWITVAIATGLGELRNGLIVRTSDTVIAVGGAYGTLSEIALALRTGVPVIGLDTWAIDGIEPVRSADEAVQRALRTGS